MIDTNSAPKPKISHNIIMEDRCQLTVSGVTDIDSFDEQTIIVITEMGELTVRGEELHINRLSLEVGELLVEGSISSLTYADREEKSPGGFFAKVFR